MPFNLVYRSPATEQYQRLKQEAHATRANRKNSGNKKSSHQEGLFKQVAKALSFLQIDPRHPSLNTHQYTSMDNPYDPKGKVFEAYAQNRTPGAYRIFWCYGPKANDITVLAITPHP